MHDMEKKRTYIAIDLKSFYASVECQMRGLDPLRTNLVVADTSRTEKTICLAVSPSLKAYGIPGRARLFEVNQAVEKINRDRARAIHWKPFTGSSMDAVELQNDKYLELSYLAAVPRMSLYIEFSTRIYQIYLQYIAPEDIHVYSIDEVFIDATDYLKLYGLTAHEFARKLIQEVLSKTGITATAGIAPNMFLCKCAMDIVAKHIPGDKDGVRIAELDEMSYRKTLWTHKPLTDFWRVGRGTARRLEKEGIYTMGDIARCSIGDFHDYYNEDLLYKMFGVTAEILIDHAWGYEPCTMEAIKNYKPLRHSLGIGQVLSCPYDFKQGLVIVKEMTDQLSLDLVKKGKVTDALVLTIGYDTSSLEEGYDGDITIDWYGRAVPKHAHGTVMLGSWTSASHTMRSRMTQLYNQIVNKQLKIRRVTIAAVNVRDAHGIQNFHQTDLFNEEKETSVSDQKKERKAEEAILRIKEKYGKNAIVKGMDFEDGATTRERNNQIGGHKA